MVVVKGFAFRATPASAKCRNMKCFAEQRTRIQERTEKIYIGRGKYISDDPEKYPSRDVMGTGGWAGGEAGLWQFREKLEKEGYGQAKPKIETSSGTQVIRASNMEGAKLNYVGKGTYVLDDARKYADKENAGFLTGATGGFAGGEKGVRSFVEKGELDLADAGTVAQRQITKDLLTLAGTAILGAATTYGLQELGLVEVDLSPLQQVQQVVAGGVAGTSSEGGAEAAAAATTVTVFGQTVDKRQFLQAGAAAFATLLLYAGSNAAVGQFARLSTGALASARKNVIRAAFLALVAGCMYVIVVE